jgi:hypothetical protein
VGEVRSLAIEPPFAPLAEAWLGASIANARYAAGRIYVVHPDPANRVSVLDADSLAVVGTIELPAGDPRDIAVMDDETGYVTKFADTRLARVTLTTLVEDGAIDLADFADDDGLPDMTTIARCGARLFVQLQRLQRAPAEHPAVAVVETSSRAAFSIPLEGPTPDYDMHVDCDAARVFVVEPVPVLIGGGGIEELDTDSLASLGFFLSDADAGGETGGFTFTGDRSGWLIFHTEFGSGPSSHLKTFPERSGSVWDTFQRVDHLAFDAPSGILFFPDPCTDCVHPPGLVAIDAATGEVLTNTPVDVGFAPTHVLVTR